MNFHNLSQRASKAARLLRSGTTGSSTTIAERVEHLNTLDVSEAATALLAMPQAKAVAILDRPELHGAAAIIAHIPVEQAARFVNLMSDDRVADVMAEMAEEPRAKLFSPAGPDDGSLHQAPDGLSAAHRRLDHDHGIRQRA